MRDGSVRMGGCYMLGGALLSTTMSCGEESWLLVMFFFFQAEDGIRDYKVTGVQTCALPIYDARSALTMLRRAARAAGRNPPTMPITMANVSAAPITPGDSANPKPISEKLWKLMTEIRSEDRRAASATPMAPPTSASTTDSTKNAPKTLRRRKPRARRVPTSTVRFATAAYMVIIAPIIAPKLKMVVTTRPRIRMNFASVWD